MLATRGLKLAQMQKKLRVGFFIPRDRVVASWQHEIIENLETLPCVSIVFFATENLESREPFYRAILREKRTLPWLLINHVEKKFADLFLKSPKVDTPCDVTHLSSRNPFVEARAVRKNNLFDYLTADSLRELKKFEPDIIICFAFKVLKGEILTLPTYGLWSYHHGDNRVNQGGPPGFWEWYLDQHTTGVTLQKLTDNFDNGSVLARMTLPTYEFSWNKNRALAYKKSIPLVTDVVTELINRATKPDNTEKESVDFFSSIYCGPLFPVPSPVHVSCACGKWISRATRRILQKSFFRYPWTVFISDDRSNHKSMRKYRKLTPPGGVFWSDPFVLKNPRSKGDDLLLAVEEFNFREKKGRISILRVSEGGATESVPVVFGEHHYSYPFVFWYGEDLWMIPECFQSNKITLYNCTEFPHGWERHKTLMEGVSATDTTLLNWKEKWWMFTNIDRSGSEDHTIELFIFYADDPTSSNWTPHRLNPVISDVTQARSAGPIIITQDGRLVRPAQDCSVRYGHRIVLFEIVDLSEETFCQQKIGSIEPTWSNEIIGTHHLCYNGDVMVVDGQVRAPRLAGFSPVLSTTILC